MRRVLRHSALRTPSYELHILHFESEIAFIKSFRISPRFTFLIQSRLSWLSLPRGGSARPWSRSPRSTTRTGARLPICASHAHASHTCASHAHASHTYASHASHMIPVPYLCHTCAMRVPCVCHACAPYLYLVECFMLCRLTNKSLPTNHSFFVPEVLKPSCHDFQIQAIRRCDPVTP